MPKKITPKNISYEDCVLSRLAKEREKSFVRSKALTHEAVFGPVKKMKGLLKGIDTSVKRDKDRF